MTWPIKFVTYATMIVSVIELVGGQYNPPANNPYAAPAKSPPAAPYPPYNPSLPSQATSYQPSASSQYPNPSVPTYNVPSSNYPEYPPSSPYSSPKQPPPYSYNNQPVRPPASSGYIPIIPSSYLYGQNKDVYLKGYLTYTKQPVDCTDQTCEANECCEFNGQRKVCMQQNSTLNYGYCVRPKRCDNNGDCPTGHCCVIRLDVSHAPPPAPYYGAYLHKEKTERGECILSAIKDEACRRSIDGYQTSICPCSTGLSCNFSVQNQLIGLCA